MLLEKVRCFIRKKNLLSRGDRVVCALSGGSDSVGLLFVLLQLREEYQLALSALHIHHGLRGEAAAGSHAVILLSVRLPRVLCVGLAGASLSLCGKDVFCLSGDRLTRAPRKGESQTVTIPAGARGIAAIDARTARVFYGGAAVLADFSE